MKVFATVSTLVLATVPAMAENLPDPGIPACSCSPAIEIKHPVPGANTGTFAASCTCSGQQCTVSWNHDIAMQCYSVGQEPGAEKPLSNCADFTVLPTGNYGKEMSVEAFTVRSVPQPSIPSGSDLLVMWDEIPSTPPGRTPNGLGGFSTSFAYLGLYKRAEIVLAHYQNFDGKIFVTTGDNKIEEVAVKPNPVPGTPIEITVQPSNGIKLLTFGPSEFLIFEVCAYGR